MKKLLIVILLNFSVFFSFGFQNVEAMTSRLSFIEYTPDQPTLISPEQVSFPNQNEFYSWHRIMSSYNCYGYAIGVYETLTPGYSFDSPWVSGDIVSLKHKVMVDLSSLGYVMIREVSNTYRPTTTTEHLIAFRIGFIIDCLDDNDDYQGHLDFHFMRYDQIQSNWFGKPGHSAVIKLQDEDMIMESWLFEYYLVSNDSLLTGWYRHPLSSYDGVIAYIAFRDRTPDDPVQLYY